MLSAHTVATIEPFFTIVTAACHNHAHIGLTIATLSFARRRRYCYCAMPYRQIQELHLEGASRAPKTRVSRRCRRRGVCGVGRGVEGCPIPRGVPSPRGKGSGRGCAPPHNFFLHFRVEMAHFVGILAVNKFYSMNKTVKIHQNPTDTSEYDAIKRGKG